MQYHWNMFDLRSSKMSLLRWIESKLCEKYKGVPVFHWMRKKKLFTDFNCFSCIASFCVTSQRKFFFKLLKPTFSELEVSLNKCNYFEFEFKTRHMQNLPRIRKKWLYIVYFLWWRVCMDYIIMMLHRLCYEMWC